MNAINVTESVKEDFQDYFDAFEKNVDQLLTDMFGTWSWEKARHGLIAEAVDYNFIIVACMNHLLNTAKNVDEASELEQEMSKRISKHAFLENGKMTYAQTMLQHGHILQQEIITRNISCPDCFTTEKNLQILRKKMDLFLCNQSDCGNNLRLINLFLKKAKFKYSNEITYLGTLVSNRHIAFNSEYHAKLLEKLQTNLTNYEALVKGLGIKNYRQSFVPVDEVEESYEDYLEAIFTIMKDNIYQPHFLDLAFMDEMNFTGDIFEMKDFPLLLSQQTKIYGLKRSVGKEDKLMNFPNMEPFIPYCLLANQWADPTSGWGTFTKGLHSKFSYMDKFCTLFRPTLTDYGICYSFNAKLSEDAIHEELPYMKTYKKVFRHPRTPFNTNYFRAKGSGVQNGLRIVLDAHTLDGRYKSQGNKVTTSRLSIQHPEDFPLPTIDGTHFM